MMKYCTLKDLILRNWGARLDIHNNYLVQLMRTTNFTKHEFQYHQSKVLQRVSIF